MKFSDVFLQIKISTETLTTRVTSKRLFIIVSVHVKCEVVHLMKRPSTDMTLERFNARVCQAMVLVVPFLVESFSTDIANEWFVTSMYPHVRIQRRRSVKRLSTFFALVGFFFRVNNFMSTQCTSLTKTFPAHLTLERACARMHGHVSS